MWFDRAEARLWPHVCVHTEDMASAARRLIATHARRRQPTLLRSQPGSTASPLAARAAQPPAAASARALRSAELPSASMMRASSLGRCEAANTISECR